MQVCAYDIIKCDYTVHWNATYTPHADRDMEGKIHIYQVCYKKLANRIKISE